MPSDMNIIIGGDGFVGQNLRRYFEARKIPFTAIMRADGDLRDRATVMGLFQNLPQAGRIFHLVTFQRTGEIQYKIPATLYDTNLRIHTNVVEAWAAHQPQAKLISTGSSCTYPERDTPMDESLFGIGPLHEPAPDAYLILPWNFLGEFLKKKRDYIMGGGAFIVPVPDPVVIDKTNYDQYAS